MNKKITAPIALSLSLIAATPTNATYNLNRLYDKLPKVERSCPTIAHRPLSALNKTYLRITERKASEMASEITNPTVIPSDDIRISLDSKPRTTTDGGILLVFFSGNGDYTANYYYPEDEVYQLWSSNKVT